MQPEMQIQTELEFLPQLVEVPSRVEAQPDWSLATRLAFRFSFVYLALLGISFPSFPLGYIPGVNFLLQKYTNLLHIIVPWVGKHILHLSYDITVFTNGSGDTTYDWVLMLFWLAMAALITAVWSVLARQRTHHEKLFQWARIYLRLSLANGMIIYGAAKAFPLQMGIPTFTKLLQPYGEASPMGILWTSIGASPAYTTFTGCVELLGGIVLIFPWLTTLGALVSGAAMFEVFALNMCYDVPVKIFSFHMILMAVFLLAPDMRRLSNLLILNRAIEPVQRPPLFKRLWANRVAVAVIVSCGLYILGTNLYGARQAYKNSPRNGPKPPLYGVWVVEEFSLDGQLRPPLTTDQARWQRMIFQFPGATTIQPMTGPNQGYRVQVEMEKKTFTLSKANDKNWKADFTFEQPTPELITVTGQMDGHQTQAKLRRFDESKFLLINSGFHWINERPFNR